MRNVIFVAPFAFEITLRFAEAAADIPNTRLILITQDRLAKFPDSLVRRLAGHKRVENAMSTAHLAAAVDSIRKQVGPIHRLLGTLEQFQVQLAEVREQLGIEGMDVQTAVNFRDKAQMKTVLRAAGLPCARHQLIGDADDAWSFVQQVGYPIVIKPPAGAGAKATYSVHNTEELVEVLEEVPPHPQRPMLAEEFIQGQEQSFDGLSIGGKLVWHSLTHYLPTPLDAVRNPWIQWCVLLPREIDAPKYDDIRQTAAAALGALGLDTGVCHMEWFRRADGSIAINEVAARPGGAQISRLITYAHDMSWYRAVAQVWIDGTFEPPARRYATGAAFLRGQGDGRVRNIRGLGQAQKEIGELVVETNLPKLGQPKSSSYEGEGFVILRHERTDVVEKALHRLISLVRVEMA